MEKSKCCGCGICTGVCPKQCIRMTEDEEGFFYPQIDMRLCVNCDQCERVCPVFNRHEETPTIQNGYIVQCRDKDVLYESTAGGAFTVIANYVIDHGGVVFGVELGNDLVTRHVWVDQKSELYRFRNSKYVQSIMGGDVARQVKEFLDSGRSVCFSGTPCQIEGLLNYLGTEYDHLITVDVVCRAVSSPLILRKYIELQEHRLGDKVTDIRFRDKRYGYKYSTMKVTAGGNGGSYHRGAEWDPWLRAFFSNMINRPSCHQCQFRKQYRRSDFTIWDCFHVGRFSKELDNDKGATRMLVHSAKGREVFEKICSDYRYVELEPEKLIAGSKELRESSAYSGNRADFFRDASVMDGVELFEKWFPVTAKVQLEHGIRMLCCRLGIYAAAKKLYVRITHKY